MTAIPLTAAYRFPGRAGKLQAQGATASLIAELGDNYSTYHRALRAAFESAGGVPQPADYSDFSAYAADFARLQEIVAAELLLRRAHATRKSRGTATKSSARSSRPRRSAKSRVEIAGTKRS